MKLVIMPGSLSGTGWPPFFRLFSTQAMFRPSVRMV